MPFTSHAVSFPHRRPPVLTRFLQWSEAGLSIGFGSIDEQGLGSRYFSVLHVIVVACLGMALIGLLIGDGSEQETLRQRMSRARACMAEGRAANMGAPDIICLIYRGTSESFLATISIYWGWITLGVLMPLMRVCQ